MLKLLYFYIYNRFSFITFFGYEKDTAIEKNLTFDLKLAHTYISPPPTTELI